MNITNTAAFEHRVLEVNLLAKEILSDEFISLDIKEINFAESFDKNKIFFEGIIFEPNIKNSSKKINGSGVGFVDSCFDAIIREYEKEYSSLHDISIVDFMVKSDLSGKSKRKSDADLTAILRVKNGDDFEYSFASTSPSLTYSSLSVVCSCITFFINAEKAFRKIYFALEDAKKRSRNDLIEKYKSQMSTLVNATSYEKVVLELKNKETVKG